MDRDLMKFKRRQVFLNNRKKAVEKVMKNHPEGITKNNLNQIKKEISRNEKSPQIWRQIMRREELIKVKTNEMEQMFMQKSRRKGREYFIEALIKNQPQVTEELIEEKAKELLIKASILINTPEAHQQQLKIIKHFIRKLYDEMPAKKPSVSEEFIKKEATKLISRFSCECKRRL